MDQRKMSLEIGVHQVMVVGIDLIWGQLTLVNDGAVGQRADVEPVVQPNGVGRLFSQDEQVFFKRSLVFFLEIVGGNVLLGC